MKAFLFFKLPATAFGILILLKSAPLHAEVFRYTDENGRTHYTEEGKVPAEYRADAKPASGRLSKVPVRELAPPSHLPILLHAEPKVEVFVTDLCPDCKKAEDFLKKSKVGYVRHDIERSAEGKRKYDSLGGGGFPLIKIGNRVIRGHNVEAITQALKSPY